MTAADATDAELELIEEIRQRLDKTSSRQVGPLLTRARGDVRCLLGIVDRLAERVVELEEPVGFHAFVAHAERFLRSYPADIFTGESGDAGPGFVATLRGAVDALHASTGPVESPPAERLGERVRHLRERRNLTVSALARSLGTDRSFIRQIENGKRQTVTLSTAARLATALGTSVDWLARGDAGSAPEVASP